MERFSAGWATPQRVQTYVYPLNYIHNWREVLVSEILRFYLQSLFKKPVWLSTKQLQTLFHVCLCFNYNMYLYFLSETLPATFCHSPTIDTAGLSSTMHWTEWRAVASWWWQDRQKESLMLSALLLTEPPPESKGQVSLLLLCVSMLRHDKYKAVCCVQHK